MVLKLLQLIGKHVVGQEDKLTTLLKTQKPYNDKYVLIYSIDLNDPTSIDNDNIYLEEYDKNKEPLYLRGTTSGNNTNYSPVFNMNLTTLIKKINDGIKKSNIDPSNIPEQFLNTPSDPDQKKAIDSIIYEFRGIDKKIVKIKNKVSTSNLDNQIINSVLDYIEKNGLLIKKAILEFILNSELVQFDQKNQQYKKESKKKAKNNFSVVIFKINKDGQEKYPGKIEAFKELYIALAEESIKSKGPKKGKKTTLVSCYTCGKQVPIEETAIPNIGFFTLDQLGFSLGFQKKEKSAQLRVCNICYQEILKGYNYVDNHLKFLAFKTNKGEYDKNGVNVYHYLIPIAENENLLKKAVKIIEKSHNDIISRKRESTQTSVEDIFSQTKAIKKTKAIGQLIHERTKKNRTIIDNHKEDSEDVDLKDILIYLSKNPVGFIDLFFYITDINVTPPTPPRKEVLAYLVVEKPIVEKIGNALANLNTEGFEFRKLAELLNAKLYLTLLKHMYTQIPLDPELYIKSAIKTLRNQFFDNIIKKKDSKGKYFHNNLKITLKGLEIFQEIGVFRGF